MPDDLLRSRLERLDSQWREDASQMHAHDRAVQARTLTMAAELTAVLEEAEAAGDSGVTAREATAIGLINAIRDLPVMVSHTGPPADREVAEQVARMILDRLPGVEPASLPFGATGATKPCGCGPDEPCDEHADRTEAEPDALKVDERDTAAEREACATEIRRKADDYESWVDPDPAFQRAHIAGMREAARFILAGENPPCVSADAQDGIAAAGEATAQ